MGGLGLDPRLGAELGEALDQPLGRPALALGGGGAVDPLQFLEPLAQPVLVRCHGAGEATGTTIGRCSAAASFTLFHVRGIRISVDWSWFLSSSSSSSGCPDFYGERARRVRARPRRPSCWRSLSAVGFFGSIVLHELGHAFAAMRNGIGITGIQLWIFGGMARMDREADSPGDRVQGRARRAAGDPGDRRRPHRRPASPRSAPRSSSDAVAARIRLRRLRRRWR